MLKINNKILLPASQEQLNSSKGIIYAIVNDYDKKTYIGKSKLTFNKRYGGAWWKTTKNILLQRVLNITKPENFKIYILEENLNTEESLNDKEKHYASLLNTYCPKGYNIRECGENGETFGEEWIKKKEEGCKKTRKHYKIKKIDTGEIIEINYLKKWCQENDIKEMALRNLLCKIVVESQGFCLPETTIEQIFEKRYLSNAKEYKVKKINTGEILSFKSVVLFAKQYGLDEKSFRCMLCGAHKTSHGYCLPETKIIKKKFYMQNDNGEIISFLKDDSKKIKNKFGLADSGFSYLINKKVQKYKGWTILRVELLEY